MCWSVWLVVSRDSRGEARDRGEGERLLFVKGWWQILTVPLWARSLVWLRRSMRTRVTCPSTRRSLSVIDKELIRNGYFCYRKADFTDKACFKK